MSDLPNQHTKELKNKEYWHIMHGRQDFGEANEISLTVDSTNPIKSMQFI